MSNIILEEQSRRAAAAAVTAHMEYIDRAGRIATAPDHVLGGPLRSGD